MTGRDADDLDLPILAELEEGFARLVRAELGGTGERGASRFATEPDGTRESSSTAPAADHRAPAVEPPRWERPRAASSPGRRAPVDSSLEPPAADPSPARRRRREREPLSARLPFPTGRRILARALAAGALAGAVGATALATKSVVGHDGGGWAPRTLERRGGHEVVLRQYRGRWCLDVTYAGGVASRCVAAPARGKVVPLSAVVPQGRVIVGLTGPDVARVTVRRSGRAVTVATHAVAGASPELRWFVAELGAIPNEARHAAVVVPSPSGLAVADCTLGTAASCRSAREHSKVRM